MTAGFFRLSPREQLAVLLALILTLLTAAVVLVWAPVNDSLARQKSRVEIASADLAGVRQLVEQIHALENATPAESGFSNLTGLVNESLQRRQLDFTRLQQLTANQVQVRLDTVNFGSALTWLHDLENTPGVIVSEITARPANPAQAELINLTVGLSRID